MSIQRLHALHKADLEIDGDIESLNIFDVRSDKPYVVAQYPGSVECPEVLAPVRTTQPSATLLSLEEWKAQQRA